MMEVDSGLEMAPARLAAGPLALAGGGLPSRRRRTGRRYRLARPLTGVLERAFRRYHGHVVDLSSQGFGLVLPGLRTDHFGAVHGDDFGEILCGDSSFGGFGRIVHTRLTSVGVEIGFHWDDYVMAREEALIEDLIRALLSDGYLLEPWPASTGHGLPASVADSVVTWRCP